MWESGQRLMQAASQQSFAGISAANWLAVANRGVLGACRKQADQAKKAVHCVIGVDAGD